MAYITLFRYKVLFKILIFTHNITSYFNNTRKVSRYQRKHSSYEMQLEKSGSDLY